MLLKVTAKIGWRGVSSFGDQFYPSLIFTGGAKGSLPGDEPLAVFEKLDNAVSHITVWPREKQLVDDYGKVVQAKFVEPTGKHVRSMFEDDERDGFVYIEASGKISAHFFIGIKSFDAIWQLALTATEKTEFSIESQIFWHDGFEHQVLARRDNLYEGWPISSALSEIGTRNV